MAHRSAFVPVSPSASAQAQRLPLWGDMRPEDDAPTPCPPHTRRLRLLLVEDDVSTVFAMREFFAHAGYDVDCASALGDAVTFLDDRPYDAVITDLHLTPRRRGEGLKVAWHARRFHPHACIVMLTAYAGDTTEEEAASCGVDVFQTKPIDLPELAASVDVALRPDRYPLAQSGKWRRH